MLQILKKSDRNISLLTGKNNTLILFKKHTLYIVYKILFTIYAINNESNGPSTLYSLRAWSPMMKKKMFENWHLKHTFGIYIIKIEKWILFFKINYNSLEMSLNPNKSEY